MSKKLWILGCGSEATCVEYYFSSLFEEYDAVKVDVYGDMDPFMDYEEFLSEREENEFFLPAIGDNEKRASLFEEAKKAGLRPYPPLVSGSPVSPHKMVYIRDPYITERAVIIHPGVARGPETHIQKGSIINNEATICHHSTIEPFCHIAPNATICGNVTVGEKTTVGAGAVIPQNTHVPPNSFIKANSVYTDS